eukprot:CAMPEP_0171121586 /NCGR_PEP_ID=MMETSP0766_2-20121228/102858_1 /TAXON_ID=439317 /ORGANISM="Gambierdiscus australes, Strain CAWD 149" /LENGTH=32 /DNA_ID= /DNA_START= /DNA_END= /DNA_ORIENTATION=
MAGSSWREEVLGRKGVVALCGQELRFFPARGL